MVGSRLRGASPENVAAAREAGVSMRTSFAFGAFRFDPLARQLTRDGARIALSDRHADVLRLLLEHPGEIVAKDTLIDAAWQGVAVTDNSLEQAISTLRRALDGPAEEAARIETVPRRGYRFLGDVSRATVVVTEDELDVLLAPHRAWVEGRAALETLSRDDVARAERACRDVLRATPQSVVAHLGLANATAFRFETTRADVAPATDALATALQHAREACRLDPGSGEAWATAAFVLHRCGQTVEARAAVARALALEPDNWRHHFRAAFVSWGEERLRAASRTLQLLPGLALAHWLAASVHVARQAFGPAARELESGRAAQHDVQLHAARFPSVGVDWLSGLVAWRGGDEREARERLTAELAREPVHHLYTRECCANAWYALGAIACHAQRPDEAAHGFAEALRLVPGHPMALAGRAVLARLRGAPDSDAAQGALASRLDVLRARGAHVEAAVAAAVVAAASGDPIAAARQVGAALAEAAPGPAGWWLPIEPLLRVWESPDAWGGVLAVLSSRAA